MKYLRWLLPLYLSLAILAIVATPPQLALEHDAATYLSTAQAITQSPGHLVQALISPDSQFIDRGYPLILALILSLGGHHPVFMQVANYGFWLLASLLVYRSLKLLKKPTLPAFLMLFSPLYLTFSAKIYSEPFASLGTALLIYAVTTLYQAPKLTGKLALFLGSFILFSTKSVFLPLLLILLTLSLFKRQYAYTFFGLLAALALLPSLLGTASGGRSLYNLSIQVSKLAHSPVQILSCTPYYLSYPLGKLLVPSALGLCHQNDPDPSMPGYAQNPYVLASARRAAGFSYADWLGMVIADPFRYLLLITVSLANIVFIEGVYPSLLTKMPLLPMILAFIIAKLLLSLYLWGKALQAGRHNWLLLTPLLYFALVVTHFPVEPRYFYPFIPYLYFLVGLADNK